MLNAYVFAIISPRNNKLAPSLNFFGVGLYCCDVLQSLRESLRVSPWMHQAGVLHAISPISMKLGQFKGSTPKLKMTNWFVVWISMVGDSPPNWFT